MEENLDFGSNPIEFPCAGNSIGNDSIPIAEKDLRSAIVSYGIEDYFIPEGSGQDWFVRADGDDDYARVIVDTDGNAVLKEIYIDGKSL